MPSGPGDLPKHAAETAYWTSSKENLSSGEYVLHVSYNYAQTYTSMLFNRKICYPIDHVLSCLYLYYINKTSS